MRSMDEATTCLYRLDKHSRSRILFENQFYFLNNLDRQCQIRKVHKKNISSELKGKNLFFLQKDSSIHIGRRSSVL